MALAEGTTLADPVAEQRRKDHEERRRRARKGEREGLKKTGLRDGCRSGDRREGREGSGQVRWSGCAMCRLRLGIGRPGVSLPRDLRQSDSALRKPTRLYPSDRAREEGGKNKGTEKRYRGRAALSASA